MYTRTLIGYVAALACCVCGAAFAAETGPGGDGEGGRGSISNHSCEAPYRQFAVSPPLQGTSSGDEGFPWRALYGYCIAQFGSTSLHQDWVVSYIDATPQGDAPGGKGVSFGTDLALQWNFLRNRPLAPYLELGFGVQYAAGTPFPAHGSRWMFTTNAGLGVLLHAKPGLRLNTAIRYLHISNAGLLPENAGYDAFHLVLGIRW